MRRVVLPLIGIAMLLGAGCGERVEELSTTAPSGTLPFPEHAGTQDAARTPNTTTTPAVPETTGDDSGFDSDVTRTGKDVPTPAAPPEP